MGTVSKDLEGGIKYPGQGRRQQRESAETDIERLYQDWRKGHDRVGRLRKVFLIGCIKSGTTWLANLLDGHPEVVIQGEGGFAWCLDPTLAQAFAAFNQHQKAQPAVTHLRDVDLLLTLRTLIDGQFYRYLSACKRNTDRVRVVGDKTPQHTIGIPRLVQIYPDARFIHIIRDPRDAATSAWFHFGRREQRPLAEYVRHFITQVWPVNVVNGRKSGRELGSQYMEVRYEDLLVREAELVRAMLRFLDVDASDEAVAACSAAGSFERRSGGRSRGQADNNSFFRSGTAGDWRNHLPVDVVDECCRQMAPVMQEFGYDPGCAPCEVKPTEVFAAPA